MGWVIIHRRYSGQVQPIESAEEEEVRPVTAQGNPYWGGQAVPVAAETPVRPLAPNPGLVTKELQSRPVVRRYPSRRCPTRLPTESCGDTQHTYNEVCLCKTMPKDCTLLSILQQGGYKKKSGSVGLVENSRKIRAFHSLPLPLILKKNMILCSRMFHNNVSPVY